LRCSFKPCTSASPPMACSICNTKPRRAKQVAS
jgi:hypothetical protein